MSKQNAKAKSGCNHDSLITSLEVGVFRGGGLLGFFFFCMRNISQLKKKEKKKRKQSCSRCSKTARASFRGHVTKRKVLRDQLRDGSSCSAVVSPTRGQKGGREL